MTLDWIPPRTNYQPEDYTWQEFWKSFEIACTDAFEAYQAHPAPDLSPDPTVTLPYSVFPLIVAVVNPLTGKDIRITRISPFDWGKPCC